MSHRGYHHRSPDDRNRPPKRQKGHPPHLKGRQIGLWYAQQGREKRERSGNEGKYTKHARDNKPLGEIIVSHKRQEDIETLLASQTNFNEQVNGLRNTDFHKEFLSIANGNIEEKFKLSMTPQHHRNPDEDKLFIKELLDKANNKKFNKFLETRQKLPCYAKMDEILNTIWDNQITLVSGETGCGKTTQIPQYILDRCINEGNGSITRIICTQPRRISAIAVSERVAEERGEIIGEQSVGYQIRLERCLPRQNGSITYCTTGVLLKQMETDPYLTSVSHVFLDEIHERNILSDFLITLLKQLITKRKDLKLIMMSATFNAEEFARYFEDKCGKLKIPGFTFPVKEFYLEDVLKMTQHKFEPFKKIHGRINKQKLQDHLQFIEPYVRQIDGFKRYPTHVSRELTNPNSEKIDYHLVKKLIIEICKMEPGAILVFVPGFADINSIYQLLTDSGQFSSYRYLIIPLHSKMPSAQQKTIFEEPPQGKRKIIISTNIAETSITINDVVYVIDCGKIKIKNYDAIKNIDSLKPEWVSLANADQRKGRAGRVKPGICYHLFTRPRHMIMDKQQKPEILRERLENVILQIKMLQLGKAVPFLSQVMDPPPPEAVQKALSILQNMNALDVDEKLTPLGYHLAKLPMSPQMGKMVLMGAIFSCLNPILSVAASLDFKDAFQIPLGKERDAIKKRESLCKGWNSDHLILHEALNQYMEAEKMRQGRNFCYEYFLSENTLRLLHDMKGQLTNYLYDMKFISDQNFMTEEWNINSENKSLVKAIIAAGLYPNIAVIKKVKPHFKKIVTANDEKVSLVKSSVNEHEVVFISPLLIYHLKLETENKIHLHDSTMIFPLPLLFFGDRLIVKYNNESSSNKETTIELPTKLPIKFECTKNVSFLISELRKKFEEFLELKVAHPGIVDWTQNNYEINVLRAIMQLITSEDLGGSEFKDNLRN